MAKVGAKTKYDESFPVRASELAENGLTNKGIAKKLEISITSFYEYKNEIPEFAEALKSRKF